MTEFYEPAKDLLKGVSIYWRNRQANRAIKRIRETGMSFKDTNLRRFLEWKYGQEEILKRCGETYPVAIFRAPKPQWNDLNSVAVSLEVPISEEQSFITKDTEYRSLIEKGGRLLVNRPIYTMVNLKHGEALGLKCGLGFYYDFLDTCQSLEWELLDRWFKVDPKPDDEHSFKVFDQKLTLRQDLHVQVDNPVRDGTGRSAALTVMTLVAFLDETSYILWVKPRSGRVAIYPQTFHVIPSGTFQPASIAIEEEWRQGGPLATLYREYLEELFNRGEPAPGNADWKYIYGDPCLRYLQELLKDGQAKLFFTGIAVNLLNLQPEICTLLVLTTPKWYKFHSEQPSEELRFSFNEEWANLVDIQSMKDLHSLIGRINYSDSDEELMKAGRLYSPNIVPTGAAAFWLGVDVLREEVLGK